MDMIGGIAAVVLVLLWILGRFMASEPSATTSPAAQAHADKWQVTEDRAPIDDYALA
jgi:hypothetical protein